MSTAAGAPSNGENPGVKSPKSKDKGKAKRDNSTFDGPMEPDEEEGDEEDSDGSDDEMEELVAEEEEEEEEEEDPEIDPSAILASGRRTRGVRVDYTSPEALEKAGLKPEGESDDDEDMK